MASAILSNDIGFFGAMVKVLIDEVENTIMEDAQKGNGDVSLRGISAKCRPEERP
jgi:hypothetical protein